MPLFVFFAVLTAAFAHAIWNALLKTTGRPWDNVTAASYACAVISGMVLLLVPAPEPESWPFLLTSGCSQCFYMYMVSKVYKKGDYAVGYPLMRGLSPPCVALFGFFVLHEAMALYELIGLACVSLGVLTIGFSSIQKNKGGDYRPASLCEPSLAASEQMASFKKQLRIALLCGVMIAGYALIDGTGARLSNSPIAYTMWVFVLQGIGIALFRLFKKHPVTVPLDHWRPWVGAALSAAAYAVALWAMTQAPIAMVSALRESSIFFSALVGVVLLKEKPSLFRVLGAGLIACGVIMFRLGF